MRGLLRLQERAGVKIAGPSLAVAAQNSRLTRSQSTVRIPSLLVEVVSLRGPGIAPQQFVCGY
jgi:hypothetical protein